MDRRTPGRRRRPWTETPKDRRVRLEKCEGGGGVTTCDGEDRRGDGLRTDRVGTWYWQKDRPNPLPSTDGSHVSLQPFQLSVLRVSVSSVTTKTPTSTEGWRELMSRGWGLCTPDTVPLNICVGKGVGPCYRMVLRSGFLRVWTQPPCFLFIPDPEIKHLRRVEFIVHRDRYTLHVTVEDGVVVFGGGRVSLGPTLH